MSEHAEQAVLIEAVAYHANQRPALRLLYAIPNGGHRSKATAAHLKAEGVRPGVPDLCLPVARGGYHGLYIEMKVKGGRVRPEQRAWIEALEAEGYCVAVAWGAYEALAVILSYERGEILRRV